LLSAITMSACQKRTSAGLLVHLIGVRFRAGAYISAV
jgi:hypothetical protein